ncbi:MAG TPA: hypothetical protein VLQ45_13030 [Thermoanaerobaculia bacterium]|nr:hypothetical protein [Thermoanaerobaculia bacterium]
MISYFRSLGESIEKTWLRHSYDEEVFPRLVLEELGRNPPLMSVEVKDIVDWIFGSSQGFVQPNPRALFGEPPVTLFQAPRFYIEALFWLSGTTAIHEHGFSGAFSVLAGSSVHSLWQFAPERTINSRMICGRLERVSTEILRPGGARTICSGGRLIHQLFHLEVPSVTIVVRTYMEPNHLPQYQYLPPGLAIDPEDSEPVRKRRLMLIDGMARGQISGLKDYACKLIDSGDLTILYYLFSVLTRRKVDKGLLGDLYGSARERHGDVIDLFRMVCEEERRSRIVTALRAKISAPDPRFLLALLMLMPDRDAIFDAIRLQFPEFEPLPAIEAWLTNMSGKEIIGFDFNNENRIIFRGLVEGLDEEGLLQRLRVEFKGDSVDEHRDRLIDHAKRLASSDLFFPLLSKSPLREKILAA